MWQVLGLQRADVSTATETTTSTTAEILGEPESLLPVIETRNSSPTSDGSFTSITIKMEVDETRKPETKKPDHRKEPEEEEEEDRPATAMSIFSNDSDDDPTWAPAPDVLKKVEKPKVGRKQNSNGSPLKSLEKLEKLFERKSSAKTLKKGKKIEKKVKAKGKRGKKTKSSKSESVSLSNTDDLGKEGNISSETSADKTSTIIVQQAKTENANDFHFLCSLCKLFVNLIRSNKW
jgi:hypothetical protein